jgi:hypothetical protein
MYVLTLMPNIALLCPGKKKRRRLQHSSRTPASHSQRHAADANRTWRSGRGQMDFHLSRLTVNVQVIRTLNFKLLTYLPSRTLGITLHQPA